MILSQGAQLSLQIRISSQDLIRSIGEVRFHDATGRETLFTGVVEPLAGRIQGLYVANVTLPNKVFLFNNSSSCSRISQPSKRFLRHTNNALELLLENVRAPLKYILLKEKKEKKTHSREN